MRTYVSARDALAALPDLHPDAALVDLQMPELSGIDVLRAIRAADPDCQVILMTGDADRRHRDRGGQGSARSTT